MAKRSIRHSIRTSGIRSRVRSPNTTWTRHPDWTRLGSTNRERYTEGTKSGRKSGTWNSFQTEFRAAAVISTPGINAPVESLTVAVSWPVVAVCAASGEAQTVVTQTNTNKLVIGVSFIT